MPEKTNKKQDDILWALEEPTVQDRYFFATNREDLLSILASGIISPTGGVFCPKSFLHQQPDSLVLFVGGLRESEGFSITGDNIKRFPVLLEYTGEIGTDSEPAGVGDVCVLSGTVSISTMSRAWFFSDEELQDFRLREFGGSPVEILTMGVDPKLFGQEGESRYVDSGVTDQEKSIDLPITATMADSLLGAFASTLSVLQGELAHFRIGAELAGAGDHSENGECRSIADRLSIFADHVLNGASLPVEFEARCFVLAAKANFGMRGSRGIDPDAFLEEFQNVLTQETLADEEERVISGWVDYFRKINRNERTLSSHELSDENNTVLRGVLLSVFYPDLGSLLHVRESDLSPGARVLSVATQLIGIRGGYLGLDSARKTEKNRYSFFANLGANLVNLIETRSYREIAAEAVQVETRFFGDVGTEHILRSSDGLTFLKVSQDAPLKLMRAWEWIRKLNYEFSYDRENEVFQLQVALDSGRQQKVFVGSVTADQKYGKIRIWSPFVNVKKVGRRKITKKFLLDLFMKTYDDGLYCHFAMSDRDTIVASNTLIEGTLDQTEFDHAVLSVGSEADGLERYFSEEDRY